MHTVLTDDPEEPAAEIPEDVATLYSWANLEGAKYRDFSGSRREHRAQLRHRAAQELLQAELKAQEEAEGAAAEAERLALEAERLAAATTENDRGASRERILLDAEEAARCAARDRVEVARRVEAAASAKVTARWEEREIAGAHASANRQAARWSESESRRRSLAGPQPVRKLRGMTYAVDAGWKAGTEWQRNPLALSERRRPSLPQQREDNLRSGIAKDAVRAEPAARDAAEGSNSPAWLYAAPGAVMLSSIFSYSEDSKERSEAAEFPLTLAAHAAAEGVRQPHGEAISNSQNEVQSPVLAVFSLAGGVGKTSLVATLGRVLSSFGEKLLLAEVTSHSLLPYYFGSSELKAGVVRQFSPPNGSLEAPVHLVSYDVQPVSHQTTTQDALLADLEGGAAGCQRVLLDLSASSGWLVRRLSAMNLTLLVPVAPDMNSVLTLPAVEAYFEGLVDRKGVALKPIYLLNHFDASLALHVDIRETLRRQLGERLLPFTIRRASIISESLAEGMTVVDYAPDDSILGDYKNVANWLRTLAAPTPHAFRAVRWSER